jgi:glutamate-1-semialdehyde aminotransferase
MTQSRWARDDAWARRGRRTDARASTRGDILSDGPSGETRFPRYAARGLGAHVWDVDGHEYIDYLLGYGPIILGHAHPEVTAAVIAEIGEGNCFSPLWTTQQVALTERLTEIIPGAELALLLKTGSEATSAAVRLARVFTGRDKVVRWGYNGWHDWSVWQSAGVPRAVRENSIEFDFTAAGLTRVLREHSGEVAAVVTMPFEFETTSAEHLQALVEIAHQHGALMIFDEMRSGFRMALGGAQEFFGVTADLATFSKAMANGFPISAVTGRRDVLECLQATKISSTFYAGSAEMAAALATIEILRSTNALATIWARGLQLQEGLRDLVAKWRVRANVAGYPPFPFLTFDAEHPRRSEAIAAFYTESTLRGLLLHPDHQWFVSSAHTEADIDETLAAIDTAFGVLRERGLT